MENNYEIALSYAHKDEKIAKMIKEELENIFANKFFMDLRKPEELANAYEFKEKLRGIFQNTNYSIILYSVNYGKGKFAVVEKEAILQKVAKEKEPHLFIININDYEITEEFPKAPTYILMETEKSNTENADFKQEENNENWKREQIHKIIHDRIKLFMIKQTVEERKKKEEYSLNIQTLFANGNIAQWKIDYDWNLLTRKYIEEQGRKLKKEESWKDFWSYIEKDFLSIKEYLNQDLNIIRKIHLNCHLSIAYKLGQIYGDLGQGAGNRNLILLSSNRVKDSVFALEKEKKIVEIEDFCKEYIGNNVNSPDIICIISIKPTVQDNIQNTVKDTLQKEGQQYNKICVFQKPMTIENINELENMAEYLRQRMIKCRTGSNCKIHLFADTMAPLMFLLGARAIFPGEIQLYEYIDREDGYVLSLAR